MPTIDLDCHGDVNWTLQTRSRLAQLPSGRLKARMEWSRGDEIGKLELTVASKLAMLLLVKNRVNLELKELIQELNERADTITRCIEYATVLPLRDPKAVWRLMVDVDSFILQSRSTYEIVGKFLKAFFAKVFERQIDERDIRKAVEERGVDWAWAEMLSKARKEFFHNLAPAGIAIILEGVNPLSKVDVLIRVEGDADFHFRDCRSIYDGLSRALAAIDQWIYDEATKLG
jgi:hypothetical protein